MPVDPMLWLAMAAFAWGLSLATYRWFAIYNGWPMGEWQAHRPGLPIAIGLFAVLFAMLFAIARGGGTVVALPLLGVVLSLAWLAMTRVAAQSALFLAPIAVILLLIFWMSAASHIPVADSAVQPPETAGVGEAAATDREADKSDRDRGITRASPRIPASPSR